MEVMKYRNTGDRKVINYLHHHARCHFSGDAFRVPDASTQLPTIMHCRNCHSQDATERMSICPRLPIAHLQTTDLDGTYAETSRRLFMSCIPCHISDSGCVTSVTSVYGYINPISSFNRLENLLPSKGGNGVIKDGSNSSIVCGRSSMVDALRCPRVFKEDARSS